SQPHINPCTHTHPHPKALTHSHTHSTAEYRTRTEMDLLKGSGKQVDVVIDKAAGVVKEKVGCMIGGGTKDQKKDQGIGGMVSDAVKGVAADAAKDSAADKAKSIGKSLFK
ncbi:hypothetical protein J4Q44_G00279200, partial [Coregonus suidteri]